MKRTLLDTNCAAGYLKDFQDGKLDWLNAVAMLIEAPKKTPYSERESMWLLKPNLKNWQEARVRVN